MTETPPENDRESNIDQAEDAADLQTAVSSDYKVRGQKAAQNGTGVLGYNTATTGRSYGVEGVTDSADSNAAGVFGEATPSNGVTYGLYGITNSDGGIFARPAGVRGSAPAGSGSNAKGVYGTTSGPGFTDATFGTFRAAGVRGEATATSGVVENAGVAGTNFSTSGIGHGVRGETNSVGMGAAGVYGEANQGSGQTYGVFGTTDSPAGYGLGTPDDARIEGELATTSGHVVSVDGDRGLRIGPQTTISSSFDAGGNVVAGFKNNSANGHAAATIAGGGITGEFDLGGSIGTRKNTNEVTADFGFIGGGFNNRAGADGVVSGGRFNTATGEHSAIGGGRDNQATDFTATIAGGRGNLASGADASIGGGRANIASASESTVPGGAWGKAEDVASFVWNDDSKYHDFDGDGVDDGLSSSMDIAGSGVTGRETFHASAQGGFRFITGPSSVTYISSGSTGWSSTSTRSAKTNIDPVDARDVLAGVDDLEISTWEYKAEDGEGKGVQHIGPMAGEFHDAFEVGATETGINSINADGVALAAIQGLSQKLEDKNERIDELETRVAALEAQHEMDSPTASD